MRLFVAATALSVLLAGAVLIGAEFQTGGPRSTGPAAGAPGAPSAGPSAAAVPSATRSVPIEGRFAIVLKDGTQFVGEPQKLDPVPLETDFGKVSIPLKLVAGLEPSKKKDAVLVHFKNGDTLTARLPLDGLLVKTRYGTINVPLAELASATAGDKLRPAQTAPVAAVLPSGVMPDPGRLTSFGSAIGKTMYFRVTGAIAGTIWGTDTYTADSPLATAAVHAGAVKLGETGVVKVTFVPGMPFHTGSVRNGVGSSSYGSYSFSYRVEKLPKRAAAPGGGRSGRRR